MLVSYVFLYVAGHFFARKVLLRTNLIFIIRLLKSSSDVLFHVVEFMYAVKAAVRVLYKSLRLLQ